MVSGRDAARHRQRELHKKIGNVFLLLCRTAAQTYDCGANYINHITTHRIGEGIPTTTTTTATIVSWKYDADIHVGAVALDRARDNWSTCGLAGLLYQNVRGEPSARQKVSPFGDGTVVRGGTP